MDLTFNDNVFGIGNEPWPSVLEKLQLIRETDLQHHEIQFCIWPGAPVSEIVDFLVETFECCSEREYSWGRLVFQDFDIHDESHHAVLSAACRNELFKYLWIAPLSIHGSAERMNGQTASILRDAMLINPSIQEICVFMQLTQQAFASLGEGLRDTTSLKKLSLHLGWNRRHEGNFEIPLPFVEGLKRNISLQTIEIDGVPEDWPTNILHSLTDHPKLHTLSAKKWLWGEASFHALDSLLRSPKCVLRVLDISYPDLITRKIDCDCLAESMKSSHSVQRIKLRYIGVDDFEFSKLWNALSGWPRLTEVDVTGNNIASLSALQSLSFTARLERLDLTHNPILNSDQQVNDVVKLLKSHYELKCLGEQFQNSKINSPNCQHMLDLNGCGRVLFRDGFEVPISIWPIVLERANRLFRESPKRQANVNYHLLHGFCTNL